FFQAEDGIRGLIVTGVQTCALPILPRKDKMLAPRYQDTASDRIPVARTGDGRVQVRVIAGESLGTPGVIDTRIPILYLHVTLNQIGRASCRERLKRPGRVWRSTQRT